MEVIALNIYNDSVKNEILGLLKKFNSNEAEIQFKATMLVKNQVTAHPFFNAVFRSQNQLR